MKTKPVFLLFALWASLLVSCDKEPDNGQMNQSATNVSNADEGSFQYLFCQFELEDTPCPGCLKDCFCAGSGGNCLEEVVVTPSLSPYYDDFLSAIENETTDDFFGTAEALELFPNLEETTLLEGLQDSAILIVNSISTHESEDIVLFHGVSPSTYEYIASHFNCDQYESESTEEIICLKEVAAYIYKEGLIKITLPVDESSL